MKHKIALDLFRAGWHPMPLPSGQKFPPPTGRTGAEGVDLTAEEITAERWDGNIATRCPEYVIGIDVDNYDDKSGAEHLTDFAEANQLPELEPTWVSSSKPPPSGIYWYQHPTGARLAGAPVPGVEIIQRHHRYAVVHPSVHPNGNTYQWSTPGGVQSALPPRTRALPELPLSWVTALAAGAASAEDLAAHERAEPIAWDNPHRSSDTVSHEVDRALGNYIGDTGSRHEAMHRSVTYLVRLDSTGEAGTETALSWLRAQFVSDVTADGSRTHPVAEAEFERSVRDARKFVANYGWGRR